MTFFLITTDHLETQLWFRDDEDFRAGMNCVAVVAFLLGIDVLAFILMSNHVHFVLASSKARRRLELKETELPSFRDQLILAAMADLCQSLFHQRDLRDLDAEQQAVLVSQIRRRFSADANQIARVTGIPYQEIARMLQGF